MPKVVHSIEFVVNTRPLDFFVEMLTLKLEVGEHPFGLGDIGFELVRVESRSYAARAGKVFVTLYPSDAFLNFAATAWAGDGNIRVIH